MDDAALTAWVGRSETTHDIASAGQAAGLAALLDHETPPWREGVLPPLGHWLQFAPRHLQSQLGPDGHPRRGGLLPPVALPRRMWAGSRLEFLSDIRFGSALERRSTVVGAVRKHGRSGEMVFVNVEHRISADGVPAIRETQDIVYRGETAATPTPAPVEATGRRFVPDTVQLFRYSALTSNSHRIHYDADYVRDVEGYPGLVVHGPFIATLLIDHYLRAHPAAPIATFEFRAVAPLFAGNPAYLDFSETGAVALTARNATGAAAMTASLSP